MDAYHVFILHNAISGPQFHPDLSQWPTVDWQQTEHGITSTQVRTLSDGRILHRVTEVRVPNVRVIPTPTLSVLGRTNNMSWAVPIDDETTKVYAIVRVPRGVPPQGTATYADGRSWFELSDDEHQRFPGDFESQVGQGAITLHSEERLATSDRGVGMVRRQFRAQARIVAEGGDPVGVSFDPANARQELAAGNYVSPPGTP
jgi:hypothetical protein